MAEKSRDPPTPASPNSRGLILNRLGGMVFMLLRRRPFFTLLCVSSTFVRKLSDPRARLVETVADTDVKMRCLHAFRRPQEMLPYESGGLGT